MKHRAIVLSLTILLLLTTSVGVSARDLSFTRSFSLFQLQDSLAADSAVVAVDSLKVPAKKDAIDAPVYYESTDSMVWSTNGNAFLYGSGKVIYDKIELAADIISMNMDSSIVHAYGRPDSTGVMTGLPIFVDGGTPYESDRMS